MAKSSEYRGDILLELRTKKLGYSRSEFIGRMASSRLPNERMGAWSENILDNLESGFKVFTDEYVEDLVEAGFVRNGDDYHLRLIAGLAKKSKTTVVTERKPGETDSETEEVVIRVFKPKNVQVIVKLVIAFAGLATLPQLWKLYEYERYVWGCSHIPDAGCGGGPGGRLSLDSPHLWVVFLLVFIVLAVVLLINLGKQQRSGVSG